VDIRSDLAEERGRDTATGVEWHRGGAPVGMTELPMRSALADLLESVGLKQ
jgi:hypothetical protein